MAKIIGKTENGYLCEVHSNEIAHLAGYDYENQMITAKGRDWPRVGTVFPLDDQWRRLKKIASLQRTLDGIAAQMRETAGWLDTVPHVVEPAIDLGKFKKE